MMKSFYPALFVIALASCGKKPVVERSSSPVTVPASLSETPLFYEKQTPVCRSEAELRLNNLINFNLYLSGKMDELQGSLLGLLKDQKLRDPEGKIISSSTYGESIELRVSRSGYGRKVLSKPAELTVCAEDDAFPENTIESVGLNSSRYITRAHKKFESLRSGYVLAPVRLSIMPSIKQSRTLLGPAGYEHREAYWVDNAIYNPGDATITFLPHSLEWSNAGNVKFWNIPMVATHEYGHHIFTAVFKAPLRSPLTHSCFGILRDRDPRSGSREVTSYSILMAYNEGFADLVSYYTLEEHELDFSGVNCLEVTRNVESEVFYDGAPKVFSRAVQDLYFSKTPQPWNNCRLTNYQEVHFFGAIFAHSANKFLGQLTASDDEKYKVLIKWVRYLRDNQSLHANMEGRRYLRSTFAELLRIGVKHLNRRFDEATCQEAEKVFEGISSELRECAN